jgi:hypothetical protein
VTTITKTRPERRVLPSPEVEWQTSTEGEITMRGYAALYDRLSLDRGGFRERIARVLRPGAQAQPEVFLSWCGTTTPSGCWAGTNNGSG